MKVVECVPNFSEGRDQAVLDALSRSIESVEGVALLDVDPGAETNRTVFTFVGAPGPVAEAAFRAARTAQERIDMRKHKGAHARMGAMDVCPFVPVGGGATMEDCVALAHEVGERLGRELDVPIYLYEHAASRPERRNLAEVRKGEYEGLAEKLADPEWVPDFGPAELRERYGATAVGARKFLIAYNVDLNTRERKLAHDIALDIRELGRAKRGPDGKKVRDEKGKLVRTPGTLPASKAVGWFIPEFGRAQISINLVDFEKTAPHQAFDEVRRQANRRGMRVTGSELVGLIPRAALLEAGWHYLKGQGRCQGLPEPLVIDTAIQSLGLDDVKPFDAEQAVVEYRLRKREEGLRALTVMGFADETSSDSTAPGGGSVAALCGSLSASLASMVANLTHGGGAGDADREELDRLALRAQEVKDELLVAIDDDTLAFEGLMKAFRMRRKSDEEKAARQAAIVEATKEATRVPLRVLERSAEAVALAASMVRTGLESAVSDCGTGTRVGLAGAEGAYLNVRINLQGLRDDDPAWVEKTRKQAEEQLAAARKTADEVWATIEAKIDAQ